MSQGTDRPCDPPDGDHPMNQLLWQQIAPFKRRAKALIIEFPTGVLKVAYTYLFFSLNLSFPN